MSILKATRAFLAALDSAGTAEAPATAPPAPVTVQAPPPLGAIVEALQVRVAGLEASHEGLKGFIREETDRAERAHQAGRRAVQRAVARLEGVAPESDPEEDVSGGDGGRVDTRGLQPVPRVVEEPPPTPAAIREAARRAVAFS